MPFKHSQTHTLKQNQTSQHNNASDFCNASTFGTSTPSRFLDMLSSSSSRLLQNPPPKRNLRMRATRVRRVHLILVTFVSLRHAICQIKMPSESLASLSLTRSNVSSNLFQVLSLSSITFNSRELDAFANTSHKTNSQNSAIQCCNQYCTV